MIVTAGSTNVSVYFYFVDDDGGTAPGEPTTGLLFSDIETGGSASYCRQGAARTDFTLVTLASASAAHTDGGFILVDDTNMPGLYRCDVPDAAFATGVDQVFIHLVAAGANNTVTRPIVIDILDVDLRDAVRGGMTALPNVNAGSAGGVPTDTDANGAVRIVDGTGARELNTNAGAVALVDLVTTTTGVTNAVTLPSIPANWITAAGINADAITAAKIATDAIGDTEISAAMANKIADHIWRRTVANVEASSNGDTIGTSRGAYVVLAKHNNKCGVSGGTLTVYQDDDTTSVITQTVTTDAAADPITDLDTV